MDDNQNKDEDSTKKCLEEELTNNNVSKKTNVRLRSRTTTISSSPSLSSFYSSYARRTISNNDNQLTSSSTSSFLSQSPQSPHQKSQRLSQEESADATALEYKSTSTITNPREVLRRRSSTAPRIVSSSSSLSIASKLYGNTVECKSNTYLPALQEPGYPVEDEDIPSDERNFVHNSNDEDTATADGASCSNTTATTVDVSGRKSRKVEVEQSSVTNTPNTSLLTYNTSFSDAFSEVGGGADIHDANNPENHVPPAPPRVMVVMDTGGGCCALSPQSSSSSSFFGPLHHHNHHNQIPTTPTSRLSLTDHHPKQKHHRQQLLHQVDHEEDEYDYFRIVYRGVVALLSGPNEKTSPRSGVYLSYGEIFASRRRCPGGHINNTNNSCIRPSSDAVDATITSNTGYGGSLPPRYSSSSPPMLPSTPSSPVMLPPLPPPPLPPATHRGTLKGSSNNIRVNLKIRSSYRHCSTKKSNDILTSHGNILKVDHILTGGYATDCPAGMISSSITSSNLVDLDAETPKRSNNASELVFSCGDRSNMLLDVDQSAVQQQHPHSDTISEFTTTTIDTMASPSSCFPGYLIVRSKIIDNNDNDNCDVVVVEQLSSPPHVEEGSFLYKIVSSTPVPVLTGPAFDAPRTKALLLPGSIVEVSLRLRWQEEDDDEDVDEEHNRKRSLSTTTIRQGGSSSFFLRLSYRRGWIADSATIVSSTNNCQNFPPTGDSSSNIHPTATSITIPVAVPITPDQNITDDGNNSIMSGLSSVLSTSTITSLSMMSSAASNRRRHRPPRRRGAHSIATNTSYCHDSSNGFLEKLPPRHVVNKSTVVTSNSHQNHLYTPVTAAAAMSTKNNLRIGMVYDRQLPTSDRLTTPSSNVSLLSDDSLYDSHNATVLSTKAVLQKGTAPPLSVSDNFLTNQAVFDHHSLYRSMPHHPSYQQFFLMRVTAPEGLKILDAPQFQVSRLMSGSSKRGTISTGATSFSHANNTMESSVVPPRTHHSIFQTMSGRLSTTIKASNSTMTLNGAVFDSISKTRFLPYGVLFEASRRLETSATTAGGVMEGAGLIKLSDNSGWVIVPNSDEIDRQYRTTITTANTFPDVRSMGTGVEGMRRGADPGEGRGTRRAFEEVGHAFVPMGGEHVDDFANLSQSRAGRKWWVRVTTRAGVEVVCSPSSSDAHGLEESTTGDDLSSPCSSSSVHGGSHAGSTSSSLVPPQAAGTTAGGSDSEIASSVGSSFLDAIFRTPTKKKNSDTKNVNNNERNPSSHADLIGTYRPINNSNYNNHISITTEDNPNIIPCGYFVEVEGWVPSMHRADRSSYSGSFQEYVRLRGGQGWIPMMHGDKAVAVPVLSPPRIRNGSFWFRVQSLRGIKVRSGPSSKAPSIKSEDGVHFRFECGEFLRASEVVTVLAGSNNDTDHDDKTSVECFAKLYRNRHIQLQINNHNDYVSLAYLTSPAEWVQVSNDKEIFLEEFFNTEPRIERHKQGWRYNVVSDTGVEVRKGPSFSSEKTGLVLLAGESVLINERVSPPPPLHSQSSNGEATLAAPIACVTWLRMKDGHGWVYDIDPNGTTSDDGSKTAPKTIMIPHSLRHRYVNQTITTDNISNKDNKAMKHSDNAISSANAGLVLETTLSSDNMNYIHGNDNIIIANKKSHRLKNDPNQNNNNKDIEMYNAIISRLFRNNHRQVGGSPSSSEPQLQRNPKSSMDFFADDSSSTQRMNNKRF